MTFIFTITLLVLSIILYTVFPFAACFLLHRKKGLAYAPFLIGCGVGAMALLLSGFAYSTLVRLIITMNASMDVSSKAFSAINVLCSALTFMLFLEVLRILAIMTTLKRWLSEPLHALMYGFGFGGAFILINKLPDLINQLYYIFNAGSLSQPYTLAEFASNMLISVNTPLQSLLGMVEYLFTLALQIALCVIAWHACSEKQKKGPYLLAVLLRCLYLVPTLLSLYYPAVSSVFVPVVSILTSVCIFGIAVAAAPEIRIPLTGPMEKAKVLVKSVRDYIRAHKL